MTARVQDLEQFLDRAGETVKIEITSARGSTPREAGTTMLVSKDGQFGTIGGGRLEMMGITQARELLSNGDKTSTLTVALGPEIGQCCGGNVALQLSLVDEATRDELLTQQNLRDQDLPEVYVFGAGHVGKALAIALAPLPLRAILVETREEELSLATEQVEKRLTAMPESLIKSARPGSAYVVLTHDHALDFLIVQAALARTDAAYVGMIGSKTKRASFVSWHVKEGGERDDAQRLVCPIGGKVVRHKQPEVIAALTAAEIMSAVANVNHETEAGD